MQERHMIQNVTYCTAALKNELLANATITKEMQAIVGMDISQYSHNVYKNISPYMIEDEINTINEAIAKINMYTIIHDYIDRMAKERLKPDLITYNNDEISRAYSEYFINASDPKFNRLYFKLPAIWSNNVKTPTTICV
jgi:hypothetical protein